MEPEAGSDQSGELCASVPLRRRTSSFNDDYSVQKTNDDATECKAAAVRLGYWADPFIGRFTSNSHSSSQLQQSASIGTRRDPEISRGYWCRTEAVRRLVDEFLQAAGSTAQIISVGAGFDTLYWRLKSASGPGTQRKFAKFVEIDFSTVTAKKIRLIRKPAAKGQPDLFGVITSAAAADGQQEHGGMVQESGHADLIGADYCLLGADVRQAGELTEKLAKAKLDPNAPTVIVAECVLIYMSADESSRVIRYFANAFANLHFINYEQVNIDDQFGRVMEKNLSCRGITLHGLSACQNLDSQKKRFLENGFTEVQDWSMQDVYEKHMSKEEVSRIESIEPLDERELLVQLLEHYCIVVASKNKKFRLNF